MIQRQTRPATVKRRYEFRTLLVPRPAHLAQHEKPRKNPLSSAENPRSTRKFVSIAHQTPFL
jgi:hypothetical protein